MKETQFNQIMNIVRHTGDRIIIADSQTDDVVVLVPLKEYRKLLNSSDSEFTSSDFFDNDLTANTFPTEEELYYNNFEPTPKKINNRNSLKKEQRSKINFENSDWFQQENNFLSEENLSDISEENEDDQEEKFYLEPIDS